MRCLIIGGAGFIGSHIAEALVLRGHYVRIFDLPGVGLGNLTNGLNPVDIVRGDFKNRADISIALENMDVVLHLAYSTLPSSSNENPFCDIETNVLGTIMLLDEMLRHGVGKIVFASSGGTVYGNPQELPIPETHPTNPLCSYGITKLTIEKYLALYKQIHDLDYTVLRMANVYGERQRMDSIQGAIAVFLGRALRRQPIIIWGDGSVTRDFLHVTDAVSAMLAVTARDCKSAVYNIGSGEGTSIQEVLGHIHDVTGKFTPVHYTDGRKMDVTHNRLNISRAKKELAWNPKITLREGIEKTWLWMKKSRG